MKFYILILSSFLILACEGFLGSPPTSRYVYKGGNSPHPYPPNHNPIQTTPSQNPSSVPQTNIGVVQCHDSQKIHFNKEVLKFISATTQHRNYSWVRCSDKEGHLKGGMFIQGQISFEQGALFDLNSPNQGLSVSPESWLQVDIRQINEQKNIHRFQVGNLKEANQIVGQNIYLAFRDKGGQVYLDGAVENGTYFKGSFRYRNNNGDEGLIGQFIIPACSFLTCGQTGLNQTPGNESSKFN